MMLDHLNSHSRIYGFPDETRILPHFLSAAQKYGDLTVPDNLRRLWLDMCKAFPFWRSNGEQPVPLPDDWAEVGTSPGQIFDWILQYFAQQQSKPIWCEKTPMHALHIAAIARELPSARFVHMIRDGRDCAASFRRRWGYHPRVTVYRWKKTIHTARSQAAQFAQNRYVEVRFEELTTMPDEVLRHLLDFLGLDFEVGVLTSSRQSARMRGIDSARPKPNSGSFRSFFPAGEIAHLESIAGKTLNELSYKTDNALGDKDLSRLYVAVKQFPTYVARLRDVWKRARNSKSPWQLLFRRIRSALGLIRANKY